MVTVPLGSLYPFLSGRAPQNGGPPTSEEYFGVGYTECPACHRDFHCLAKVQNGLLISVAADRARLPYVHDREQLGTMACPNVMSSIHRHDFSMVSLLGNSFACQKNVPRSLFFQWKLTGEHSIYCPVVDLVEDPSSRGCLTTSTTVRSGRAYNPITSFSFANVDLCVSNASTCS